MEMTLPNILHFVWIGDPMPAWAEANIAEWVKLNPDHRVMIHTEKTLLPCFVDHFQNAKHLASKADLIRLSALKMHGGWYADVDFWPLRPLSDAVRAWRLKESDTYISQQQGHISGDALPFANGILAAGKDSAGLQLLIDLAMKATPGSRCAFGPEIVKQAVAKSPEVFTIANAGWWFPVAIKEASDSYPLLRYEQESMQLGEASTGWTMPYAAHLWAGAVDLGKAFTRKLDGRPMAVVQKVGKDDHALNGIADGLEAVGYAVFRVAHGADWRILRKPSLVVCWNGRRDKSWRELANRVKCPALYVEHGFFQRGEYSQVDHSGILHWASWAKSVRSEPPSGSDERLAKFVPNVVTAAPRNKGPILVLGQVDGDTQMDESEIPGAVKLLRTLEHAIPRDIKVFFRPHPIAHVAGLQAARRFPRFIVENENAGDNRAEYAKEKQSKTLAEALAECRFAVAINSNSLVEAVAAGVPCLAFGPAIGITAGAFRQGTIGTAPQDIQGMLAGWTPRHDDVVRFLRWLSMRQWSPEELRLPGVICSLLHAAGAPIPGVANAI
jgi:hypothetical protein